MKVKQDTWPIDGTQHHNINRSSLYTDAKIDSFLDTNSRTLIIATKGMGKTLLLRAKKKIYENAADGTLIIPRHTEYDEPQLQGSLAKSGLEDISLWLELWKCAINISILTHVQSEEKKANSNSIFNYINNLLIDKDFKENLIHDICEDNENPPSHYLSEILKNSISSVQNFRRTTYNIDTIANKFIRNSVAVFIDAFDQTLTDHFPHSMDVWRNAQLGLAKAVHRLNTNNKHVKVFATIRQEAYSGFQGDDREVIKGRSLLLEYSSEQLHSMLLHAIQKYSKKNTIEEFFHLSEIYNGVCGQKEEIFSYIYRHSTATPRSIVFFGKAIEETNLESIHKSVVECRIMETVNRVGSENLFKDYLMGQKRIFLNTLCNESRIRKILSLIPANILDFKTLKSINKHYSKLVGLEESGSHPFCELFNIGILGIIKKSTISGKKFQLFRKPFEFSWTREGILKEERIYLVHPSLYDAILEERDDIFINPVSIVGDTYSWDLKEDDKVLPLLFVSHSSDDKSQIDNILQTFEDIISCYMPSTFWYDKWSIRAGGDIHQEVERGVEGSDFVLVFISKNSLKSGWVQKEWKRKHFKEISNKHIQVIAIIIDDTNPEDLPGFLPMKKAVILSPNNKKNHISILSDLSKDIAYYIKNQSKPIKRNEK